MKLSLPTPIILYALIFLHAGISYADDCQLIPLQDLLDKNKPALQATVGTDNNYTYKAILLNFVTQDYSKILGGLSLKQGEYYQTLHEIMGTKPASFPACDNVYKNIFKENPLAGSFAAALLDYRLAK